MTLIAMTPVQSMEKPYARRWAALFVLCLSLLVVVMANTSLLVAAPAMTLDLGLTSSDLQWVVDGYTVPYASLMLLFGVLGDRFSRRGALILGLLLFTGGSVFGALSDSTFQVISARVVMGVAAAVVMPATLSLLVATFPKHERATAVTVWAATSGLAIALGPLLAGYLLQDHQWGTTFLINVPVTVFAIVFAIILVPPSRAKLPGSIDILGGVLSVLTVAPLVFAIIEGLHFGWTYLPIYAAVISGLSLVGFVVWELNHSNPLLDVRAFSQRALTGATFAVLIFFLVTFGTIYFVAQYLQFVLNYTPLQTGIHLLPLAGAVFAGSAATNWLTPWLGIRVTIPVGMLVGAAGVFSLSRIHVTTTYSGFLPVLMLLGLAIGLSVSPCTDAIMDQFPENRLGVAGGLNDTALELGGSLGIAFLASIVAASYKSQVTMFLDTFPVSGLRGEQVAQAAQALQVSGDSVGGAMIVAGIMRENPFLVSYADKLVMHAGESFTDAVVHTSIIAAVIFAVGGILVALVLPRRPLSMEQLRAEIARLHPGTVWEPVAHSIVTKGVLAIPAGETALELSDLQLSPYDIIEDRSNPEWAFH